jgi:hypothetical protein
MEQMKDLNFAEEIKKMEYEPLDATEKRLVAWSLGLGAGLLVLFYFVSDILFPGAHG